MKKSIKLAVAMMMIVYSFTAYSFPSASGGIVYTLSCNFDDGLGWSVTSTNINSIINAKNICQNQNGNHVTTIGIE